MLPQTATAQDNVSDCDSADEQVCKQVRISFSNSFNIFSQARERCLLSFDFGDGSSKSSQPSLMNALTQPTNSQAPV